MKREVTQFSMFEVKAAPEQARNAREQHMLAVKSLLSRPDSEVCKAALKGVGEVDNIQGVRVLALDGSNEVFMYEFVAKLPLALWEERKRAAEREARKKAVLAKAESLKGDRKAFEKYVREVVSEVVGRAAAANLLGNKGPAPTKAPPKPRRKPRDAYEAALAQDKRNRIEAAKKAAAEYHAKKSSKGSVAA